MTSTIIIIATINATLHSPNCSGVKFVLACRISYEILSRVAVRVTSYDVTASYNTWYYLCVVEM